MTTDPTRSEWREAYEAWLSAYEWPYAVETATTFRAGYLAAQPKRPSVESIARVIANDDEKWDRSSPEDHRPYLDQARRVLALFESPAHDR